MKTDGPEAATALAARILSEATAFLIGDVALWPVTHPRRREAAQILIEAIGGTVDEADHPPRIALTGRTVNDAQNADARISVAVENLHHWMRNTSPGREMPPRTASAGTGTILRRMGMSPIRVVTIVRILGNATIEDGRHAVMMHMEASRLRTTYRSDGVQWQDGMVEARWATPPRTIAQALCGMPLGAALDEPMLADATIRHVCMGHSRDGRIRIATQDHLQTETRNSWSAG